MSDKLLLYDISAVSELLAVNFVIFAISALSLNNQTFMFCQLNHQKYKHSYVLSSDAP